MAKGSRRTRKDDAATAPNDDSPIPGARVEMPVRVGKPDKPSKSAKRAQRSEEATFARAAMVEKKAAKVAKQRAKIAKQLAKRSKKAVEAPRDAKGPKDVRADGRGKRSALERAGAAAHGVRAAAAFAGDVLHEAAGLARQAAEPAADRILRAVAGRPTNRAVEGEPAPPAADGQPDLAPELERASEPKPDPERDVPASPEALRDATSAEPEPDPEHGPAPTIVPIPGVSVGASVDVGANSVHLLVAAVGGHQLQPLVDESVFLGLGDRIERHGYLGTAARGELVAALVGFADAARRLGATEITFVGTEPMRRAADAATVTHEVERHAEVPLHVLGHDEEGYLTLIGVTAGRPVHHELVVVDVGGGSSEIVVVGPGRAPFAAGLALGSARLTQRLVLADPPTQDEINALAAEARRAVTDAPQAAPEELVAVGGTVSNLLKIIPAAALERVLTRRRIAAALAMLATEPSAQASQRHAVNPTRARILPAGAVIVDALLEHYGLDGLRVSEDGIREGTILVAAHAGRAWRDRLPELALGWRLGADDDRDSKGVAAQR